MEPHTLSIDVVVTLPRLRDSEIERAERALMPHAMSQGCGILVTRLDHGRFRVALHGSIPAGTTVESSLV